MINKEFKNRFKSFLWRLSAIVAVAVLEFVSDNIGLLSWSPQITGVIGLVVGEMTKYLNKKHQLKIQ